MTLLIVLLGAALLACSGRNESAVPSISTDQLKQLVDSGEDVFLLDVRTEPEFVAARLPFSDLRISYDSLGQFLDLLPENKSDTIYCFCRTGRRSAIAARYLISQGYQSVFSVRGGIKDWQSKGWPTSSGPAD